MAQKARDMIIPIDVTDWKDEILRLEEEACTEDDLVTLAVENGNSSAELFRWHVISRELGKAEKGVLPDNKTIFQSGGTHAVSLMMKRRWKEIEIKGRQYRVPELVGSAGDDSHANDEAQGDSATYESSVDGAGHGHNETQPDCARTSTWHFLGSPEALDAALHKLEKDIPGRITNRLLVIRESGGDVRAAVSELQDRIESIVEALENGA